MDQIRLMVSQNIVKKIGRNILFPQYFSLTLILIIQDLMVNYYTKMKMI